MCSNAGKSLCKTDKFNEAQNKFPKINYLTCVHHDMWFHFIGYFFESGLKNFVSIRSLSHLLSLTQIEERNVVFTSGDMDL